MLSVDLVASLSLILVIDWCLGRLQELGVVDVKEPAYSVLTSDVQHGCSYALSKFSGHFCDGRSRELCKR